jgi:hypothetical protein
VHSRSFKILERIKSAPDEKDMFCLFLWIADIHRYPVAVTAGYRLNNFGDISAEVWEYKYFWDSRALMGYSIVNRV